MKKLFTFLLSFLGMIFSTSVFAEVGEQFWSDILLFEIINENPNEVKIVGIDRDKFNNENLSSIELPSVVNNEQTDYNVTTIGYGCFRDLSNLQSLSFPYSINTLEECVFYNCESLTSLTLYSITPPSCDDSSFYNFNRKNCKLTVPEESLKSYKSNEYWGGFNYSNYLEEGDFIYNGIKYTILNESQKICKTKDGVVEYNHGYGIYEYYSNNSVKGDLVIPSTVYNDDNEYKVVYIGAASFAGNDITSLEIPETVTEIGDYAFIGCENLVSIQLPNSLNTIDNGAFLGCKGLIEVDIPDSVTEMKEYVFAYCSGLKSINLPNYLTVISASLCMNCTSLESIRIPDSVTHIGSKNGPPDSCFEGCISLKDVEIPNSVIDIGYTSFKDCTGLTSIVIPNSVTYLGYAVFQGCTSLTDVKLSENLTSISQTMFEGCTSLETIEFPEGVKYINGSVLKSCYNLKSVIFPSTLQSLGNEALMDCKSLNEIKCYAVNPPKCYSNLFDGCYLGYSTLYVPVGSKELYSQATSWKNFGFIEDDLPVKATSIYLNYYSIQTEINESIQLTAYVEPANVTDPIIWTSSNEAVATVNNDGLVTTKAYGNAVITATCGNFSVSCYFEVSAIVNDGLFKYNIVDEKEKTVILCAPYAYDQIRGSITLNAEINYNGESYKVIGIGDYAFTNCDNLVTITLPSSIERIGDGAFSGCSSLEKIYLNENLKTFGIAAFAQCSNLRSFIIPEGITDIPQSLLYGCSSINEILIPNSVISIGEHAFRGCSSLKNIDLGTGVYSIGDYAFADCPLINNIHSMALNPPIAQAYTFPNESYTNATVTVQEQALTTYNRENPWYRFRNYLTVSGAISLSHYNVDMAGNEVFQLGVYGSDSKIEWSSSNPSVAYANDCGLIVAMGITGSTVITANVDGEKINCNVTVSSPYRDPNLNTRTGDDEDIQPVDVIIESISGNPPMVNARLVPVGSKTIIDWTSSDNNIAKVENGIVTIYSDGDVDFGVETENGLEETIEVDTQNIDEAGIQTIFEDSDIMMPLNVYDLKGRIIYFNATPEQIKTLDKGLYIIKGKKILVK